MNSFCAACVSVLVLGLLPCGALALDLHVDPRGNVAWSGRLVAPNAAQTDGPLASLDGARRAVRKLARPLAEPVRVILAGGIYRIEQAVAFDARDSGETGRVISYEAAAGAEVVISGGKVLPPFTAGEAGRWELKVPAGIANFEQLWVSERRAVRARAVSQGYPFLRNLEEEKKVPSEMGGEVYEQTLRVSPADLQAFRGVSAAETKDAVINFYHKWDNTRRRVESVDLVNGLLVVRGGPPTSR
jgi:hypothetical protein